MLKKIIFVTKETTVLNRTINIKGELRDFTVPWVMGIINVAPDSFYKASRALSPSALIQKVDKMLRAGADIIDVGAYSSRPGADEVSAEEEMDRLRMSLGVIRKEFPDRMISLDTFRSDIARAGIEEFGVDIINDISGGMLDRDMFSLIAEKNVPYILMHMQGTPANMQNKPSYNDVVSDILFWFSEKIGELVSLGVRDIIIDPGFGFGKSLDHNYELIRGLEQFQMLGRPLLVGVSRKSMIYRELGKEPEDTLAGTIALNTLALDRGADIIRVHDVEEAVQTVKIFKRAAD